MYSEIYKSEANSEQIVIREKKASSTLTGHVKKNQELNLSKRTSMPNPPKEKVGNSNISPEEKKKKKRRQNPENKYYDQ